MRSLAFVCASSILVVASSASAAVVTSGAFPITSASDVLNPGANIVSAVNYGASGAPSPTVNGVAFTANTGTNVSAFNFGTFTTFNGTISPVSNGTFFNVGSDVGLSGVLNTLLFESSTNAGTGYQIALTGLTVGKQYDLQVLVADRRTNQNHNFQIQFPGQGPGGATVTFPTSGNYQIGGGTGFTPAANIRFTFDALSTSQNVIFVNRGGATAFTSGYVLSVVPEPSSIVAFTCVAAVMLSRRAL